MPSNQRKKSTGATRVKIASRKAHSSTSAIALEASPRRSRRTMVFALLCASCLLISGAYVAWAVVRDDGGGGATGGAVGDDGSPGTIARMSSTPGAVMFQNVVSGDYWDRVGMVPLDQPDSGRTMIPLRCQRVYFAADRGLCLAESDGIAGSYRAFIFDMDANVVDNVKLGGMPSRARVSPDGRYGAATSFVSGHSYAEEGFSTETLLIDLRSGDTIGNLEDFETYRDGEQFEEVSFNFWGVTFASDSDRFYATLGNQGDTYLVEGSISGRQLQVLRENVECPSLSPDNTRIAYKKLVQDGLGGPIWRFHVLDLATMTETPLAETRSIDDQIEWFDDSTILYGDGTDTWMLPADGSGEPERYLSKAISPIVVRGPGEDVAASTTIEPEGTTEMLVLENADLGVSMTYQPTMVSAGQEMTITVSVTNAGPVDATWLTLEATLPAGSTYVSTTSAHPPNMTQGCAVYGDEGRVRCDASVLSEGQSWSVVIKVVPNVAGPVTSRVTVGATEVDPNPINDAIEQEISVAP